MTTTARPPLRSCLREPIPEIEAAAKQLAAASRAHLAGNRAQVVALLHATNLQSIRDWTESIWGKNGAFAVKGKYDPNPPLQKLEKARMPNVSVQRQLHTEGGYYCRFCKIPVIRRQIREFFRTNYPESNLWGTNNIEQHAAFQCMWAQYDHVLPHARGGSSNIDNLVVTCAPCNYGRMNYTLSESGLHDPRDQPARIGAWTGLEEVLQLSRRNEA